MWRKRAVSLSFLALSISCGSRVVVGPIDAHDVSIVVRVPGRCIVGGCDPVNAEAHTLVLTQIRNLGTATAFLHACGTYVALGEQQLVGGRWVNVGPAPSCVPPPHQSNSPLATVSSSTPFMRPVRAASSSASAETRRSRTKRSPRRPPSSFTRTTRRVGTMNDAVHEGPLHMQHYMISC